jgi:hypothetical protein
MHGRFALMEDRSFLVDGDALEHYFPCIATALVEEVGRRDECETDDDLREAAAHGETLLRNGVFTTDEITDATETVIRAVMEWAKGNEACSLDS